MDWAELPFNITVPVPAEKFEPVPVIFPATSMVCEPAESVPEERFKFSDNITVPVAETPEVLLIVTLPKLFAPICCEEVPLYKMMRLASDKDVVPYWFPKLSPDAILVTARVPLPVIVPVPVTVFDAPGINSAPELTKSVPLITILLANEVVPLEMVRLLKVKPLILWELPFKIIVDVPAENVLIVITPLIIKTLDPPWSVPVPFRSPETVSVSPEAPFKVAALSIDKVAHTSECAFNVGSCVYPGVALSITASTDAVGTPLVQFKTLVQAVLDAPVQLVVVPKAL